MNRVLGFRSRLVGGGVAIALMIGLGCLRRSSEVGEARVGGV